MLSSTSCTRIRRHRVRTPRGRHFCCCSLSHSALLCPHGRAVLQQEGPPAFFVEIGAKESGSSLGEGFPHPGIHQFSDGTLLLDVIEMTGLSALACRGPKTPCTSALHSGELLYIGATELGRSAILSGLASRRAAGGARNPSSSRPHEPAGLGISAGNRSLPGSGH